MHNQRNIVPLSSEKWLWISLVILCVFAVASDTIQISGIIDEETILECDLPKSNPPNIIWRDWIYNMDRDPALIFSDGNVNPEHSRKDNYAVNPDTFALTIKKVTIDDAGEVYCESVINDTTTLKKSYAVSPTESPMCTGNVELVEGEGPTKLTCAAKYSGTIPTMEWFHGNEALIQKDEFEILHAQVSVDIEANPDMDQQEIVCKMNHIGKMAECKMTLNVQYLVRDLEIKPMANEVRVNEKITCMARGNPAPSVELNPGGATGQGSASIMVGADWLGTVQEVSCTAGNSVSGTPRIESKNTTYEINALPIPKTTPVPETPKKTPNPDNNEGEEAENTGAKTSAGGVPIALVVGIVIGVVVVVVIIIAVVCIKRRKTARKQGHKPIPQSEGGYRKNINA